MKTFNKALITGAAGGIGQEISKELCQRCDTLILAGRNKEGLEKLKDELVRNHNFKGEIDLIVVDLLSTDFIKAFQKLEEVDLLVNNAGLGFMNYFESSS